MTKTSLTREQKAAAIFATSGVVGNRLKKLREVCQSFYDVLKEFDKYKSEFIGICSESMYKKVKECLHKKDYLDDIDYLEEKGIGILTRLDEQYPKELEEIADAPEILYYIGNLELFKTPKIAVVGSRKPSEYAKRVASQIVPELARAGLTIVSGMAMGIDGCSHQESMNINGKTIAVLGTAIDVAYPAINAGLYDKLIANNQLIISEYAPKAAHQNAYFVARNRLISGLSSGVVIIEAGLGSGSLITASNAIEQNRNLYVIPCPIINNKGAGSNNLIKEHVTCFVRNAEDILDDMNIKHTKKEVSTIKLDYIESIIEEALSQQTLHFDELLILTRLEVPKLIAILSRMELMGLVTRLEGNYYSK